jgi:hypothetical protein
MTTTYQQAIFTLSKSLESFEKSIDSCNIHKMLDENVAFVEILKNANKTFESLPPKTRSTEVGTYNKSKELVRKYFTIRGKINDACSCMSVSH